MPSDSIARVNAPNTPAKPARKAKDGSANRRLSSRYRDTAWIRKSTPKEIMAMGTIRSRIRDEPSPARMVNPLSHTNSIARPRNANPTIPMERRVTPTTTNTRTTVATMNGIAVLPCS